MTGEQRRAACSIAVQLQRAARSLARAIQAADAGDEDTLTRLLDAELDVAGVGHRLALLRRGVATARFAEPRRHVERDDAGRFAKVQKDGAP